MIGDVLALQPLKDQVQQNFVAIDRFVAKDDRAAVRRERRRIQARANQFLSTPAARCAGWYVFANFSSEIISESLLYVGVSETKLRPIARRIMDRFKDDSCLDDGLMHHPHPEREAIVRSRLVAALPNTGINYIAKHLRTLDLVHRSSHILMVGSTLPREDILLVEKSLIGSAMQGGANLFNIKHRKHRSFASGCARSTGLDIIDKWEEYGLPSKVAGEWRSALLM